MNVPIHKESGEILIISETNTVVNPGTMVVHFKDTSPANRTMMSSVRFDTNTNLTVPEFSVAY